MDRSIKSLIWLYLALLIFEGSLRKWVFPGLSDMLLIVRDPVVILIYLMALAQGRMPSNGWIIATAVFMGACLVGSFLAGQDNLLITVYGLRTNFLHLPLIWVMATVLTRRDVENMGKAILLLTIPMTLLMVAQFKAAPDAYINRGVGTDDGIGQLYGALGHIRPPGFFSFITGPQLYFPLAAAFFCHELNARRKLWWPLLAACGVAIVIALPVSISRTVAVATSFIGLVYVLSQIRLGLLRPGLLRTGLIAIVVLGVVGFLPVFDDAREAFLSRWETAQGKDVEGVGMGSIFDRLFGGWDYLSDVASSSSLFGSGIGMGSNVASKLSTGRMGFMLAESEWAKCFLELGLPLGAAFLGYRIVLALALAKNALQRLLRHRDALPVLLFSAAFTPIIFGQWAPPTILGFAVVGGGLCLGACQDEPQEEASEEDEAESYKDGDEDDTDEPNDDAEEEENN